MRKKTTVAAQPEAAEQVLHDPELAALMGWAADTPRNYRCRGLGPPFRKQGRRVYYLLSDVTRWLRSAPLYRSTSEAAVDEERE